MKFTPVFKKAAADLYTRLTLVALKLKKSVDDLELLPVACKLGFASKSSFSFI